MENPADGESLFAQNAALLPLDYGRYLDPHVASQDPFYAISDIFRLCAVSENQVLNLLQECVAPETDQISTSADKPTLSNLLYLQRILEAHLERLRSNENAIRRRGGPHWPRANSNDRKAQETAQLEADALLLDFQRLVTHAELVSDKCTRGVQIILNNSMLRQSQQAIEQANRVARLTLIAFIYIPLSFTTSFFGMNIAELGVSGGRPMWWWGAISGPTLLLTVAIFYGPQLLGNISRSAKAAVNSFHR